MKNKEKMSLIELLVLILLLGTITNVVIEISKKEYNQKFKTCMKEWESTDYCTAIVR